MELFHSSYNPASLYKGSLLLRRDNRQWVGWVEWVRARGERYVENLLERAESTCPAAHKCSQRHNICIRNERFQHPCTEVVL
jgi:hypothetical protein